MFFDKLQAICDEKGIAMSSLLDEVGMSRGNIARWKDGKEPKPSTIMKLAEALGVDRIRLEEASEPAERRDILDEVDVAFYGDYKALTEDDRESVRDFVRIMRERRAKKQR